MRCPTVRGKHRLVSLHLVSLTLLGTVAHHVSIAQQNSPVHLSLNQAIDLAIKQNRSVHLHSIAVENMRSKKDEARSNYMPELKTSGGIHHVTELAGIEIPAGAFGNFPSTGSVPAKSLFIDQGSDTGFTGGVELDQPLTQLLRIHQANVAAEKDVLVAQTQFSQAQADVALNARKLYYGILISQQQLQASQEQLEAMRLKDSVAQEDVEHGNALEITTFQTKASILEAQQKTLTLKLQGEDLKRELVDLLGLPIGKQIDLDPDIPAQSNDLPSCSEAVRIALEQNQDIRAARHALAKAKAELAVAKDAYIPDVTGSSRYSYQSGVPLLEHNFGTFGFSLSYELFDGGRREAQVRSARTAVTSAQVSIDRLESGISVEIQAEYDRVEELKEMVGVVQQAVEVRREATRLADRRFEQNALLSAARSQEHADLSNATALLLEANLNLSLAEAEVKKTIGQIPR